MRDRPITKPYLGYTRPSLLSKHPVFIEKNGKHISLDPDPLNLCVVHKIYVS